MKRPSRKAICLIAAVIVAPPAIWGLVLLTMPMGWARSAIERSLRRSTGQEVRLGEVRLRALGGVKLSRLEIAAPGKSGDPWLKVVEIAVDVAHRDLLFGRISPSDCRLSGVTVRIRRDASGRLEFEDAITPPAEAHRPAIFAGDDGHGRHEMTFGLEGATVSIRDDATDTTWNFSDVSGNGTCDGVISRLVELSARINGGEVIAALQVDRSMGMTVEGQIRAHGVSLDAGAGALAYSLPLVAPKKGGRFTGGKLSLDVELRAKGESTARLDKTLAGRGTFSLESLTLDNSRVMGEVEKVLPLAKREHLGSLRGSFTLAGRRVTTGDAVLTVGDVPVDLTGWSDFDGALDYRVNAGRLARKVTEIASRLPPEARELLADLPIDDLPSLAEVRVSGTIDDPVVTPIGGLVAKKGAARADERAKVKAAGRKILDRLMR